MHGRRQTPPCGGALRRIHVRRVRFRAWRHSLFGPKRSGTAPDRFRAAGSRPAVDPRAPWVPGRSAAPCYGPGIARPRAPARRRSRNLAPFVLSESGFTPLRDPIGCSPAFRASGWAGRGRRDAEVWPLRRAVARPPGTMTSGIPIGCGGFSRSTRAPPCRRRGDPPTWVDRPGVSGRAAAMNTVSHSSRRPRAFPSRGRPCLYRSCSVRLTAPPAGPAGLSVHFRLPDPRGAFTPCTGFGRRIRPGRRRSTIAPAPPHPARSPTPGSFWGRFQSSSFPVMCGR